MNFRQSANPNATNSELDAKTILQRGIETPELLVSLTEEQISTILYIMEGYIVNSDDTNDEQFNNDVDDIFEVLQNVVPAKYYDNPADEPDWTNNLRPPFTTAEYNKIKESVDIENVTDEWYDEEGNLKHD